MGVRVTSQLVDRLRRWWTIDGEIPRLKAHVEVLRATNNVKFAVLEVMRFYRGDMSDTHDWSSIYGELDRHISHLVKLQAKVRDEFPDLECGQPGFRLEMWPEVDHYMRHGWF